MMRMLYCAIVGWMTTACFGGELKELQEAPRFRPTNAAKKPSLSAPRAGLIKQSPGRDAASGLSKNARAPQHRARVWVDSTGRYQTEAVVVSHGRDAVTLRRSDGVVVRVPVNRLSRQDQDHLERLKIQTAQVAPKREPPTARETPHSTDTLPADLVYVHVSDRMLRQFLSRPVARSTAVNDTIVGTPVRGTAGTSGTIGLQLAPSAGRAAVDLSFQGHIQSQTTGFGGPVRVHSTGLTHFSAVKRVMLDEHGIELFPARVAARTSTAIQGVTTSLPRLRGWIARRIGSKRAAQMQPAAEAESARKAEAWIGGQFDREVVDQLLAARRQWLQVLASLPIDADLLRGRFRFATSGDYLQLAINRGAGAPAPNRPPSPVMLGSPDLAVHVHSSLVDRVVANAELQRALEPFLNMLLAEETQRIIGIVPIKPRMEVKQSADGAWWSLVVSEVRPAGM